MLKTVIITGASSGIGAATAEYFAEKGYYTVINYLHSKEKANGVLDRIKSKGGQGIAYHANVSDSESVRRMMNDVYATTGRIDILVNNAGISYTALLQDMTEKQINDTVAVNLMGTINCSSAVIPFMLKSHSGSIVNISSIWGVCGASCETVYSASKAGIIGFTKALAKELGPSGIRVNCIAPGVIDTEMNAIHSKETMQSLADETPLMRIGKPDDIAKSVYFISSDDASFITGQILTVDGGFIS